jgi:mRNA interferase RelE/StbE
VEEAPHRVGAPLRKPFDGHWRARRGEYRVRYTIDDGREEVVVLDISHRRDAYR